MNYFWPPKIAPLLLSIILLCSAACQKQTLEKGIIFSLYTVSNRVMKMTVQLYETTPPTNDLVRLEIQDQDRWVEVQTSPIIQPGSTAHFRVENWDMTKDFPYRISYKDYPVWTGIVRKDPVNKDIITAAVFTGNGTMPGVSKSDIVENLKIYDPDLLIFTGDQVYRHTNHLLEWIQFGLDFREIIKDRPTICMPDDHDVGQGNLWGDGGVSASFPEEGGYIKDAEYIKMVERAQASHLPDPYDPTPVAQGIGVYYTSYNLGEISFAILEDRKFKSGCFGLVNESMGTRADHITAPNYFPESLDIPDANLLGERQLAFLRDWTTDWKNTQMKVVVSQTIFANLSTHSNAMLPYDEFPRIRIYADLDSNGWPQSGRNRALQEIRKGFAFMIGGDQHLASVIHHGIEDWNDAGFSFCVPSVVNFWPRWWEPDHPGNNRQIDAPYYTGEFLDGFNNKITVYAVANPQDTNRDPAYLHDLSPGFGLVIFNKSDRTITMECYPRQVNINQENSKEVQYEDWPITIHQYDNYARKPYGYLPEIIFVDREDPVIQVIHEESNEIEYTLRINGSNYIPKTFQSGRHILKVGEIGTEEVQTFLGLIPEQEVPEDSIHIRFDE